LRQGGCDDHSNEI